MGQKKAKNGFTYIEAMIAIMVSFLLIAAVYRGLTVQTRKIHINNFAYDLKNRLRELQVKAMEVQGVGSSDPNFSEIHGTEANFKKDLNAFSFWHNGFKTRTYYRRINGQMAYQGDGEAVLSQSAYISKIVFIDNATGIASEPLPSERKLTVTFLSPRGDLSVGYKTGGDIFVTNRYGGDQPLLEPVSLPAPGFTPDNWPNEAEGKKYSAKILLSDDYQQTACVIIDTRGNIIKTSFDERGTKTEFDGC